MERIIISGKKKFFLVNLFKDYKEVLNKFDRTEPLKINGRESGLTPQNLLCGIGNNKKKLRTKAAVLFLLEKAVKQNNSLTGCGLCNDFSYIIVEQVERIVAKLSDKRPFKEVKSLYHEHANKRVVVKKDNYLLSKLVRLGVVNVIPEGTFFGNTPKEFNNYWVEVNRTGCWYLADKLIEKEMKNYLN